VKADQIAKVALRHFTEHGYEGTSLSDIGEEVGIKKQSIYSHFKSKDELFITVMNEVIASETKFMHGFFSEDSPDVKENLKDFILLLKNRYSSSGENNIKFILRMAYMPPAHLEEGVIVNFNKFFLELEELINRELSNEFKVKAGNATLAFMTMLDGLLVALTYGSESRFDQKFKASWEIYWNGLICEDKEYIEGREV
jgi:AcrR family transcriptional regulator